MLMVGDWDGEKVTHVPLVGFITRRVAQTAVRERKRQAPYEAQYDYVLGLHVYATVPQWKNGERQRAKRKAASRTHTHTRRNS